MSLKDFWQIYIQSFYKPNIYIMVAEKWRNWGLGYLIRLSILIAITSSSILFILMATFNFHDSLVHEMLKQIPDLKIEQNIAHFADDGLKSPIRIKASPNSSELIIVDMAITDAVSYSNNVIVFTSDRIAFNMIDSPSIAISYKDLFEDNNITLLNSDVLLNLLEEGQKKILGSLICLGVTLGGLCFFVLTLIKSFFYAGIANIMIKLLSKNMLNFKKLTRLAILANGPAITVSMIMSLLFFDLSSNAIVQFIVGNIYIFYFVSAIILCNRNMRSA